MKECQNKKTTNDEHLTFSKTSPAYVFTNSYKHINSHSQLQSKVKFIKNQINQQSCDNKFNLWINAQ